MNFESTMDTFKEMLFQSTQDTAACIFGVIGGTVVSSTRGQKRLLTRPLAGIVVGINNPNFYT